MALPTTQDLKVIEGLRLVHFKESHRVWNRTLELLDMFQWARPREMASCHSLQGSGPIGSQALEEPPSCKSNCPWLRSLMEITVWIFSERDESTSAT